MPRSAAAAAVTARHAVTPPGRRMTARPETLDVVGGLERFECLDLPAKLSRSACGQRYSAATKITPGPQGAVQRLAAGPCSECPVGKLHAGEQRRGQLAQLQVVRDGRRSTAPKPAPAHVEAPAAVVPPKRTSSRPPAYMAPEHASSEPAEVDIDRLDVAVDDTGAHPTTPAPAAGAQPAANPDGGTDASATESPSPPVVEPPLPPSGEQAAGGRRARTVTCLDCGTVVPRTSNRQKRCGPCGTQRNRAATAARNRLRRGRDPDGARARTRAVAASTGAHGPLPGILITHDGTTDTIEGWATRTGLSSKTIRRRWAKGLRGSDLLGPRRDARADHDRRRAGAAVERSAPAKAAERLPTVERPVEAPKPPERRVETPASPADVRACEELMQVAARYAVSASGSPERATAARRIEQLAETVARGTEPRWIDVIRAFGFAVHHVGTSFDVEGRAVILMRVARMTADEPAASSREASFRAIAAALGHDVTCFAPTNRGVAMAVSVPLDSWEAWCT